MRGIAKQRVWEHLGWPSSCSWQVSRGNTTAFAALGTQPRGGHAPHVHFKYRYMKSCIFSLDGRQSRGQSPISYVPCSIFACGWVICTAHPQNIFRPFVGASITKSMQFAICSESNDVKEEDGWYRDDAAD